MTHDCPPFPWRHKSFRFLREVISTDNMFTLLSLGVPEILSGTPNERRNHLFVIITDLSNLLIDYSR